MGQLAKALQRANYLKNFVEGINALSKAKKYDEIVTFLGQALSQDLKSTPTQTSNEGTTSNNTALNSLITGQPTIQTPQTQQQSNVEFKGIQQEGQAPQTNIQPAQTGTASNVELIAQLPIQNENEQKVSEIIKNYEKQKQDYLERVKKAQEQIKNLLTIGSIINTFPTMDENQKKSLLGLITSRIEGLEKSIKLEEPSKPEVYDVGNKKIIVFGGSSYEVPERSFTNIGQAKEVKETGEEIVYESFITPDGKVYRIPITKDLSSLSKEKEKEQEKQEKKDKELQERIKNIQKKLGDAFSYLNLVKSDFNNPRVVLKNNSVSIVGNRRTVGGDIPSTLENALFKIGDLSEPVDIAQLNATKKITNNFEEAFNDYVIKENPDGSIISLTNIPINYKKDEAPVSGLTNFKFKKELAKELVKEARYRGEIDIYNFYRDKVSRIVANINNSYGDVLGEQDINTLTNYYLIDLLANWNIYKTHINK